MIESWKRSNGLRSYVKQSTDVLPKFLPDIERQDLQASHQPFFHFDWLPLNNEKIIMTSLQGMAEYGSIAAVPKKLGPSLNMFQNGKIICNSFKVNLDLN